MILLRTDEDVRDSKPKRNLASLKVRRWLVSNCRQLSLSLDSQQATPGSEF